MNEAEAVMFTIIIIPIIYLICYSVLFGIGFAIKQGMNAADEKRNKL